MYDFYRITELKGAGVSLPYAVFAENLQDPWGN